MTIPQPITLRPQDAGFGDQVSALPDSAGLYCLMISEGSPHLAWSANLSRRVRRLLLANSERSGAADLLRRVERVECWPTGSKLESSLLMYAVARRLFPEDYGKRLRLRMPWFVGIGDRDGFPRLMVTNRRGRGGSQGALWGPFTSRDAAEYYEQEVLRLFQLRRCTEALIPAPEHPGCIYGEMKQCLRPCQRAVTVEEYQAEFGRVSEFLQSNGRTELSRLSTARQSASENMEFEQAAQIHKRIEQVKAAAAAREDFVAELQSFQGVAITRGSSKGTVRLWPMMEGYWQESITIDVSAEQVNPKSMDSELRERLAIAGASGSPDGNPFEHLSLFLRWHQSSWRDGEWVGSSSLGALNYRRLVREISKLARDEA